jgi:hypothetical protein
MVREQGQAEYRARAHTMAETSHDRPREGCEVGMSDKPFFRIVHAAATHAEAIANELAEGYQMSAINFYVLDGVEKVAMMWVKKQPIAAQLPQYFPRRG